jgi:hypothetical protein
VLRRSYPIPAAAAAVMLAGVFLVGAAPSAHALVARGATTPESSGVRAAAMQPRSALLSGDAVQFRQVKKSKAERKAKREARRQARKAKRAARKAKRSQQQPAQ